MFGKMDAKQMASLMKQMGIKTEDIDAQRVVIEKTDGSKLIVENPSVQAIEMQGQRSFQIAGKITEEASGAAASEKSDADIIMEECNCTREQAEAALEKANGDLAEAILSFKN